MSKLRLAIVIGSIRPNRFGGHAAQWIEEVARRRGDFEVFAFVGYGGVGGARAVEQLRLHAIELQMADPQRRSHLVSRLPGCDQRRQAAKRARASQSGRPADARSAGMV